RTSSDQQTVKFSVHKQRFPVKCSKVEETSSTYGSLHYAKANNKSWTRILTFSSPIGLFMGCAIAI
ncbi:MAG: hypothetical protein AB4058_10275, partial [Microcystaceae cyanobacterium]